MKLLIMQRSIAMYDVLMNYRTFSIVECSLIKTLRTIATCDTTCRVYNFVRVGWRAFTLIAFLVAWAWGNSFAFRVFCYRSTFGLFTSNNRCLDALNDKTSVLLKRFSLKTSVIVKTKLEVHMWQPTKNPKTYIIII